MTRTLLMGLVVLGHGAYAAHDAPQADPKTDSKKTAPQVYFFIGANGIIDHALKEGGLPALVFGKQTPMAVKVTELRSADPLVPVSLAARFGLNPGTYQMYSCPMKIGKNNFGEVGFLLAEPAAFPDSFKLSDIKFLTGVYLTIPGGFSSNGGTLKGAGKDGAEFGKMLFSASLDVTWTGKVENNVGPFYEPIDAAQVDKAKARKDVELLQGTWKCTSPAPGGRTSSSSIVFQGEKLEITAGNFLGDSLRGKTLVSFVVDPSKHPKQMDITSPQLSRGRTVLGIYELEGNKLKMCFACAPWFHDARPPVFAPKFPGRDPRSVIQQEFANMTFERVE